MDPLTERLLFARAQMGMSLAFHIVFAAAGVALPLLMVLSDLRYRRSGDADFLELSRKMAKGTAILFAVGAVSGTVLSFELGLLWPGFLGSFGELVGLAFSLEGFAFFIEAIFLGIYLYGRGRVSPTFHLFSGVMVALSGAASALFVTLVNAFMNSPAGFTLAADGTLTSADPVAAMLGPAALHEVLHTLLSCYQATAFAMLGIHAAALLKRRDSSFHRKALFQVALPVACLTALLQPLAGDLAAKRVAEHQPIKLAAMEAHFETARGVPLRLGGIADEERGEVRYALEVPRGLSFLAFGDFNAQVQGLRDFPRDRWPPVAPTHVAFELMVGAGTVMAMLSLVTLWLRLRKRLHLLSRRYLWALLLSSPLGVVAMEAGWLVTEWGRQPWVVTGALRTRDAVTPFPHLAAPFWIFTGVYLLLAVAVVALLWRQVRPTLSPQFRAAGPEAAH